MPKTKHKSKRLLNDNKKIVPGLSFQPECHNHQVTLTWPGRQPWVAGKGDFLARMEGAWQPWGAEPCGVSQVQVGVTVMPASNREDYPSNKTNWVPGSGSVPPHSPILPTHNTVIGSGFPGRQAAPLSSPHCKETVRLERRKSHYCFVHQKNAQK